VESLVYEQYRNPWVKKMGGGWGHTYAYETNIQGLNQKRGKLVASKTNTKRGEKDPQRVFDKTSQKRKFKSHQKFQKAWRNGKRRGVTKNREKGRG